MRARAWWLTTLVAALGAGGCDSSPEPRERGGGRPSPARTEPAHRVATYRVPSPGMAPTLHPGDVIRVDLDAYRETGPRVGDVIAFHPPRGAPDGEGCGVPVRAGELCPRPAARPSTGVTFLKRIVAGPGDRVRMVRGRLVRNGRPEPRRGIRLCSSVAASCTFRRPYRVPPGHWMVLGDNRGASDDSRFWGPVPSEWIVGRLVSR